MAFSHIETPEDGEKFKPGETPENPVIPIIHGDGIGEDVAPAAKKVLETAAEKTGRSIEWMRLYAGESARNKYGENLPEETVEAIREYGIGIKGPLTTPVGSGFRSLNVAIRKELDLYVNMRPAFHLDGVPSPMKEPEKMDITVFRENTEDVYAGIEWKPDSEGAEKARNFVERNGFENVIHEGSAGMGVKPITEYGSKRLVREAISYALENNQETVTLVHKGNIMKYTEGAFRDWGYEVAEEEFPDRTLTEEELWEEHDGEIPEGKVVVKDRIADNMLQQLVIRPEEFDVIATTNLNGDYISDAAGGQIGGLGIAPGSNLGDEIFLAEAVHGSAPEYAGENMANPTAMILSGSLLFEYMGWEGASRTVRDALETTIKEGTVTFDLYTDEEHQERVSTTEFAEEVVKNM